MILEKGGFSYKSGALYNNASSQLQYKFFSPDGLTLSINQSATIKVYDDDSPNADQLMATFLYTHTSVSGDYPTARFLSASGASIEISFEHFY